MSDNIYEAPKADLVSTDTATDEFFTLSLRKLWIMNIVTIGIYSVVWFWAHWRQVKVSEKSDLWPVPRAIFAIIFVYPLFMRIEASLGIKEQATSFKAGQFALLYILAALLGYGVNFIDETDPTMLLLGTLTWIPSLLLGTFCMSRAQVEANNLSVDLEQNINNSFTIWNYLWLLLGGLMWLLTLIGLFATITGLE
ncbi:MAG: hypothetical protein AAF431_07340 [Pseudomonadota bacterium]